MSARTKNPKILTKIPKNTATELLSTLPSELTVNEADVTEIKAAAKKVGLSLELYLKAIKDALSATKTTIDKYGEEHIEDDHDKRLKAAMMGLEVEGYVRAKGAVTDNSKHTHVTYSWKTAVISPVGDL